MSKPTDIVTRFYLPGYTLHEFVEIDARGNRIDLDMKLAQLGANAGADGKLHDRDGRRIEIVGPGPEGGGQAPMPMPPPSLEALEAQRKHLEEEAKRLEGATVIRMQRDPNRPFPP